MEPAGWVLIIVVSTQVICHVANTFIREYFYRFGILRELLDRYNLDRKVREDKRDANQEGK